MKRPVAILGASVLLLGLGGVIGYVAARRPPGPPAEDAAGAPFAVQALASGWTLQHLDDRIPLRALRWVPGQAPGLLVAQVATQNDGQQLHLFRDGRAEALWRLERPAGVEEGFFRFAELREALPLPDGGLLALLAPGNGTAPAWLVALGPAGGPARWSLRVAGDRLATVPAGKEPAVLVWGPAAPVSRVPLVPGPQAPKPESIDLPTEAAAPAALLSLGGRGFLVAHARGLSVHAPDGTWAHHPAPAPPPLPGPGAPSPRLARAGTRLWWQPRPGTLVALAPSGQPEPAMDLDLGPEAAKDGHLLRLLGSDPEGGLWFDLATPVLPATPTVPATPVQPPEPGAEPPAPAEGPSPEDLEAWRQHAAQGLGRLYRRAPGVAFRVHPWSEVWRALPDASGWPLPTDGSRLSPGAGLVLIGGERKVWWLRLGALGEGRTLPR